MKPDPSTAPLTTEKPQGLASIVPFYYGWLMIPIAMLAQACTSPGQTYGVSVFNKYLRESLQLSSDKVSFAYFLGTLLASLPLSFVGALMDRYGIRKTMVGVVIALGITCMGVSKVYNFWTLLLAFFFLRFLGQGALTLLSNNILAMWFNRKLGLASGIKSQAGALSMGLLPGVILWSIQSFGWRETFVYMGFTIWILLLPLLILFYRNRPEDIGLLPDGESFPSPKEEGEPIELASTKIENEMEFKAVLRTPTYWILLGINIIWGMIATAIIFHLVSIYESNQLTEKQAASCLFIFAMSIAAFQFLGGWLADHFRPTPLITVCLIGMACGTFCLVPLNYSIFIGVAFAILFGGSQGALNSISNTVWPRFYGRANLGKIRGTIWTAAVIGSSAGPWLLSIMAELKGGNFDLGLSILAIVFIPFIIASFWIRPPQIQTQ